MWWFILPLGSLRGLTSIDGCSSVNKTHGSNQMTVEHRSTRHGTSRSAQSSSQTCTFFFFFTHFEQVLAFSSECLKNIRYVWWGCCFKRFSLPDWWCSERMKRTRALQWEAFSSPCTCVWVLWSPLFGCGNRLIWRLNLTANSNNFFLSVSAGV